MNLRTVIAITFGLGALAHSATAQTIDLGPITNPANGHVYYRLTSSTWTAAEAFAQTIGGHLVTINNAAENEFVRSTFAATTPTTPGRVWIGLTDQAVEGTFAWSNGEPFVYSSWDPGEPNNNGDEDYALMYDNGRWNDAINSATPPGLGNVYGVVEVAPGPFSIGWFTIDGGGATVSGAPFQITGSIGQPDAATPTAGGSFTETGGFWPVALTICSADYDGNGTLAVADIFAYLNGWFAGNLDADFNGSGALEVADIFAFLSGWFAGC